MASSCLHALMSRLKKDRQQVINAWPDGWMDAQPNDDMMHKSMVELVISENDLIQTFVTLFKLKPIWDKAGTN